MPNNIKQNTIKYNMISSIYKFLVTLFITTIIVILFNSKLKDYMNYIKIGYIIMILVGLFNTFIKPFIEIKVWNYHIDDKKIEYSKGVFTIKKTVIPISRVQQISTATNPLLNKMGLVKVNIITTTTSHNLRNISIEQGDDIINKISDILDKRENNNLKIQQSTTGENHERS